MVLLYSEHLGCGCKSAQFAILSPTSNVAIIWTWSKQSSKMDPTLDTPEGSAQRTGPDETDRQELGSDPQGPQGQFNHGEGSRDPTQSSSEGVSGRTVIHDPSIHGAGSLKGQAPRWPVAQKSLRKGRGNFQKYVDLVNQKPWESGQSSESDVPTKNMPSDEFSSDEEEYQRKPNVSKKGFQLKKGCMIGGYGVHEKVTPLGYIFNKHEHLQVVKWNVITAMPTSTSIVNRNEIADIPVWESIEEARQELRKTIYTQDQMEWHDPHGPKRSASLCAQKNWAVCGGDCCTL